MEIETDSSLAKSNQVFVPAGTLAASLLRLWPEWTFALTTTLPAIRDATQVSCVWGENYGTAFEGFFHSPDGLSDDGLDVCRFAVLLALIGIYGIVSNTVAERTQEMGLRMALGATPARVRGMLLTQSLLVGTR